MTHQAVSRRPGRSEKRRGGVLVIALTCLLVAVAMVGQMLRGSLQSRRYLRSEYHARQAEQLLRAGVLRAAAAYARDAEYRGERWDVPAERFAGAEAGRVVITFQEIESPASESQAAPSGVRLCVVAEYPLSPEPAKDNIVSVRRSCCFVVPTSSPQDQE